MMNDTEPVIKHAPVSDEKKNHEKADTVHATYVSPGGEPKPKPKPKRSWNISAFFWGLLLVTLGTLLLLGNLGLVDVNWSELWRLWPLLIVGAGFSVLAATHWLWKVLAVVFIIAAILSVVWVGTGMYKADTTRLSSQTTTVDAEQGVKQAEVTIQAGASKLRIHSEDTLKVLSATLRSDNLKLEKNVSRGGVTQKIMLASDTQHGVWFGSQQNSWDVTMTERLPINLTIDAGASSIDADVSKMQLTILSVQAGASSAVITLGNKQADMKVDVDSGASSTVLRIPKESGVAMSFDGGLSSREFGDLKQVAEGEYQSENYKAATRRITITADAGAASFKIERY